MLQSESPVPRPIFLYGTLQALPLLAWVLTGDQANVDAITHLLQPAKAFGYARFCVHHCDYPAVVKQDDIVSSVDGLLLQPQTTLQRTKVDNFEGEAYTLTPVQVVLDHNGDTVEADMYVWNGEEDIVSAEPWELSNFVEQRLQDWLDLFEGFELV